MVVATKVRARMWDGPDGEGLSKAHIVKATEGCLRRLRTDRIDLLQAHWPDEAPLEETVAAFEELVTSGKVRYWGTSNFAAFGALDALLDAARAAGAHGPVCEQPRYNLMNRNEFEGSLQAIVEREGMGMICFSPLAGGFLTGKYRKGAPQPDSVRRSFVGQYLNERGWTVLDTLDAVATAHTTTVASVSLAWILAQPGVTAPVVGANSAEQLEGWVAAPTVTLEEGELAKLSVLGWDGSEPEFVAW